jgi:hypothetical protein
VSVVVGEAADVADPVAGRHHSEVAHPGAQDGMVGDDVRGSAPDLGARVVANALGVESPQPLGHQRGRGVLKRAYVDQREEREHQQDAGGVAPKGRPGQQHREGYPRTYDPPARQAQHQAGHRYRGGREQERLE